MSDLKWLKPDNDGDTALVSSDPKVVEMFRPKGDSDGDVAFVDETCREVILTPEEKKEIIDRHSKHVSNQFKVWERHHKENLHDSSQSYVPPLQESATRDIDVCDLINNGSLHEAQCSEFLGPRAYDINKHGR